MNDPSPDLIKNVDIHVQLNEKQLSYDQLFQRIDKNNDGKIDFNELVDLLEKIDGESSRKKHRVQIARVSFQRSNIFVESFFPLFFRYHRILSDKAVDPKVRVFHLNNLLITFRNKRNN